MPMMQRTIMEHMMAAAIIPPTASPLRTRNTVPLSYFDDLYDLYLYCFATAKVEDQLAYRGTRVKRGCAMETRIPPMIFF